MQQQRKDEHLFLAEKLYQPSNAFQSLRFIHHSLPETEVTLDSLKATLFGHDITAPLYINAMTGGSHKSKNINRQLAKIAHTLNIPIATGSMSAAIKYPEMMTSFSVMREENPDGLIFANLGAEYGVKEAKEVVNIMQADAIQIHVNTAQEIVMPEGNRSFHWLDHIDNIVNTLDVPVIVKEVGFGMSRETLMTLEKIGVQYVDISGRGGTNFVAIEDDRAQHRFDYLHQFGQTTPESLLEAYELPLHVFASGGIQTPLDAIKALALKAEMVGMAGEVLHHLFHSSVEETTAWLQQFIEDMTRLCALLGSSHYKDLVYTNVVLDESLRHYVNERHLSLPPLANRSIMK